MKSIAVFFIGLSLVSVLYPLDNVQAADINNDPTGRAYSARRAANSLDQITGAQSTLSGGYNALSVGPATANSNGFTILNKDMWVRLGATGVLTQNGCWIEAMVKSTNATTAGQNQAISEGNGSIISPSYKGYSIARLVANNNGGTTYTEIPFGINNNPAAATGGTIEISKFDPTTWKVNINGVTALTIPSVSCRKLVGTPGNYQSVSYTPTGASAVDWGIESNDTTNAFTNGTSVTAQVKIGSNAYTFPGSTTEKSTSPFTPAWYTTYSAATGKIEMKR